MIKFLTVLSLTAAWCCADAMRVVVNQGDVEGNDQGALANQTAPKNKAAKPTCDEIYNALVNIPVRASGCNPSHGKKEFCCDSWMIEFGRQLQAENNVGRVLMGVKLRMKLWKWLIRPGGDKKKNAHHASMGYDHTYLQYGNHDNAQWEHVGKDSHYFTIVNYCPRQYAIFDTVKPVGRDVSSDFNQTNAYGGNILTTERIAGPFRFSYSETIGGEPQQCAFEDCVAKGCESKWIDPRKLKPDSAKSKKGARCFLGITF